MADEITIEVIASPEIAVDVLPGSPSGGGGGTGLVQYPDSAALDAVALPEMGILVLADTAGTYPELSSITGNGGSAFIVTTSLTDYPLDEDDAPEAGPFMTASQTAIIHSGDTGSDNGLRTITRLGIVSSETGEILMPYGLWRIGRVVPPAPTDAIYVLKSIYGEPMWIEEEVAP